MKSFKLYKGCDVGKKTVPEANLASFIFSNSNIPNTQVHTHAQDFFSISREWDGEGG